LCCCTIFFSGEKFCQNAGNNKVGLWPLQRLLFWKIMRRIAEKRKFSNQLKIRMISKQTCNRK
jgi:hypothetical protein